MNTLHQITDPITILNVVALFLTATCLTFLLLESLMRQLGHGAAHEEHANCSRLAHREFIQRRILRLFEVGGLISLPKRSLSGQRIG